MAALTLITAFEVPPDADEEFVAGWERAHARGTATLHRALRADVALRFVEIASPAADDADRPALAYAAHPGTYGVEHEDGDPDGAGGVLLIDPVDVPAAEDERFLAAWNGARERLTPRQGYLGSRLHRSVGAADYRFVAVVRWSSPLMFARALQQPEIARALAEVPFHGHPALYLRHAIP